MGRQLTKTSKLFTFKLAQESAYANLDPNDVLTVYHGTGLADAAKMINGFDANEIKPRLYGGPRHAGLFVTPSLSEAERFAHYGQIIIEIRVLAKFLHGTDYSGNIGRGSDPHELTDAGKKKEYAKELFPNSFRPYLSYSLNQSVEPQALLRGLVSPKQITRIRYQPYQSEPIWYTREEFLGLDLKYNEGRREKDIKDVEYDISYPNYSYEELISMIANRASVTREKAEETFNRYQERGPERLRDFLQRLELGETATERYSERFASLKEMFLRTF